MTKPLQPAFLANKSGASNNVTGGGTGYDFASFTEVYDQNADFNASTGVFTAPVTGRYLFQALFAFYTVDSNHTLARLYINASNQNYYIATVSPYGMKGASGDGYFYVMGGCMHDLDAADTVIMTATIFNGSDTSDAQPASWFSGHLVC